MIMNDTTMYPSTAIMKPIENTRLSNHSLNQTLLNSTINETKDLSNSFVSAGFTVLICLAIPANVCTLFGSYLSSRTSRKHRLALSLWGSNLLALVTMFPIKIIHKSWNSNTNFCLLAICFNLIWISQVMLLLLMLSTTQFIGLYQKIKEKSRMALKIDGQISVYSIWVGSIIVSLYIYFSAKKGNCENCICSVHTVIEKYFAYCYIFFIVILPLLSMAILNFCFHKLALHHINSVGICDSEDRSRRVRLVSDVCAARVIFRLYYCALCLFLPKITLELLSFAKLSRRYQTTKSTNRAHLIFDLISSCTVLILPLVEYVTDRKLRFSLKQCINAFTRNKRSGYITNQPMGSSQLQSQNVSRGQLVRMSTFTNISPHGPNATLGKSFSVDENLERSDSTGRMGRNPTLKEREAIEAEASGTQTSFVVSQTLQPIGEINKSSSSPESIVLTTEP